MPSNGIHVSRHPPTFTCLIGRGVLHRTSGRSSCTNIRNLDAKCFDVDAKSDAKPPTASSTSHSRRPNNPSPTLRITGFEIISNFRLLQRIDPVYHIYPSFAPTTSGGSSTISLMMMHMNPHEDTRRHHVLIFGAGYIGHHLALAFRRRGFLISATVRSDFKVQQLLRTGVYRHIFVFNDETQPPGNLVFHGITHVINTIPPSRQEKGDPVYLYYHEALRDLDDDLLYFGYLSSVSVYGDHPKIMISEQAALRTKLRRAQQRINAEQSWLGDFGSVMHIFRLPGVYGPGRGPLANVRRGNIQRINYPGRMYNFIHVDDVIHVILTSIRHPNPTSAYNLTDDCPVSVPDVVAYCCTLLKVSVPPVIEFVDIQSQLGHFAKLFFAEGRIISNKKIKQELDVTLIYPSYREGFQAQVEEEEAEEVHPLSHMMHRRRSSLDSSLVCLLLHLDDPYSMSFCDQLACNRKCGNFGRIVDISIDEYAEEERSAEKVLHVIEQLQREMPLQKVQILTLTQEIPPAIFQVLKDKKLEVILS